MAILGLINTESDSNWRFKNVRRRVFYQYPNGAAPLTGLLSLMSEEDTDDPEFSWYEDRYQEQTTTTASQGTSKGPFLNSAGADLGDGQTITAGTEYRVKVAATTHFRVWHVIKIPIDRNSAAATGEIQGIVTSVVDTTTLQFRATQTVTLVDNGTTNENVSKEVMVIGTAVAQGQDTSATSEITYLPINPSNATQIFRTPFSFTGTALKTGLKWDETGPYKGKAKTHSVRHMTDIEFAFLFGMYSKRLAATTNLPTYTTQGVLGFLKSYESADTDYRGGTGAAALTADTEDGKRIITNSSGRLSEQTYEGYLERVFRSTNNTSQEKLVLCGSGFLSVINQMYKSKTCLQADLPMTDTYGMNVVAHQTPFGKIYYKTHPLFSQNTTLRKNALFVDVGNLKYRFMQGRDTELLKHREPNDADYRKDEWFTECGLELRFPESFMYIQNVSNYAP